MSATDISPHDPDDGTPRDREPIKFDPNRRSRLDREVEEILQQSEARQPLPPIPFKQRTTPKLPHASRFSGPWREVSSILLAFPLFTAVGLGILCLMVSDFSPLLAQLVALASVSVLLYPIVLQVRQRSMPGGPKMWRGQVMDSRVPHSVQPTPVDSLRQWWNSRNQSR